MIWIQGNDGLSLINLSKIHQICVLDDSEDVVAVGEEESFVLYEGIEKGDGASYLFQLSKKLKAIS